MTWLLTILEWMEGPLGHSIRGLKEIFFLSVGSSHTSAPGFWWQETMLLANCQLVNSCLVMHCAEGIMEVNLRRNMCGIVM